MLWTKKGWGFRAFTWSVMSGKSSHNYESRESILSKNQLHYDKEKSFDMQKIGQKQKVSSKISLREMRRLILSDTFCIYIENSFSWSKVHFVINCETFDTSSSLTVSCLSRP